MAKIVLLSCGSRKLAHKAKANEMYTSPLFQTSLLYAESLKPDKIYILSAKYGLLRLDEEIEPYDVTLCNIPKKHRERKPKLKVLTKEEKNEWAKNVIRQLGENCDLNSDKIIFLTGENYFKKLIPHIKNYELPLRGVTLGNRLSVLKERLK